MNFYKNFSVKRVTPGQQFGSQSIRKITVNPKKSFIQKNKCYYGKQIFAILLLLSFSNLQRHIMRIFILMCLLSTSIQEVLLENAELVKLSGSLKVTHSDCSAMQENKEYALNQVAPCKVRPKNNYTTYSTIEIFQWSYRTYVNAVMCKVKTFPIPYNCGMWADSSTVHNMIMVIYKVIIPHEDCAKASIGKKQ